MKIYGTLAVVKYYRSCRMSQTIVYIPTVYKIVANIKLSSGHAIFTHKYLSYQSKWHLIAIDIVYIVYWFSLYMCPRYNKKSTC